MGHETLMYEFTVKKKKKAAWFDHMLHYSMKKKHKAHKDKLPAISMRALAYLKKHGHHRPSDNIVVKFVDDTTVIGLIDSKDESAHRGGNLGSWCS